MSFSRIRHLVLSGLLLCCGTLLVPKSVEAAEVVLTARPGLCLVEKINDKPCVMSVVLDWTALKHARFCLFQSAAASEPLQCWEQAASGQTVHGLTSRENVTYWLQRNDEPRRLAPITVRIVGEQQRNPLRRRRRHPWSVL